MTDILDDFAAWRFSTFHTPECRAHLEDPRRAVHLPTSRGSRTEETHTARTRTQPKGRNAMTDIRWTETTADWGGKANPYRRHEANVGGENVELQRTSGDKGRWYWCVNVYRAFNAEVPGGDLPDDEAKRLALPHYVRQLRKLLEALS